MSEQYTAKDVLSDLRFLMSLTMVLTLDDEGFWSDPTTDTRYLLKHDTQDPGKEVVAFQDPLPFGDYYYFNPYSEGLGKNSEAVQTFFNTSRVALTGRLKISLTYIAEHLLEAKAAQSSKEDFSVNHVVTRMSSIPIDRKTSFYDLVDEKLVQEFKTLCDRTGDLIQIAYWSKPNTTKVTCDALTGPDWDEKYGKDIRKKSLIAFKTILMGLLGIQSPEELERFNHKYDPTVKSAPKLHTTMQSYYAIYDAFNDILSLAVGDDEALDLGEFAGVINRMPSAYALARHMIQPTVSRPTPVDPRAMQTGGLGLNPTGPQNRFSPAVVSPMGGGLALGGSPMSPISAGSASGRFQPVVLTQVVDPTAPATRNNQGVGYAGGPGAGTVPIGGGLNPPAAMSPMGGLNLGGSFQNNFGGGGLDLGPPDRFSGFAHRPNMFR